MDKQKILKEISSVLRVKDPETFTCSKENQKEKCQHEARGWNSARYVILQHFEKMEDNEEIDLDF